MNPASSSRGQRGDSRSSNTLRDRQADIADELNLDDNVLFLDDDDFQTFFQDDYYSRLNLGRDVSYWHPYVCDVWNISLTGADHADQHVLFAPSHRVETYFLPK